MEKLKQIQHAGELIVFTSDVYQVNYRDDSDEKGNYFRTSDDDPWYIVKVKVTNTIQDIVGDVDLGENLFLFCPMKDPGSSYSHIRISTGKEVFKLVGSPVSTGAFYDFFCNYMEKFGGF